MFHPVNILQQYDQTKEDPLRILVVGAGIAGTTAAQMLRKDGRHPVLIERNSGNTHPGYMLALMPMADPVLDDLGVRRQYLTGSVGLNRYALHSHRGKLVREDSMAEILNRYGDYRGIARGELLEVLTAEGCPVAFGTTVKAIEQRGSTATAVLESGEGTSSLDFDLIIIADGIHSSTRGMVVDTGKIDIVDTRWGGWVVWAPEDANMDLGEELWGAGFFAGVYPVKGSLGVFIGGAREDTQAGPGPFVAGMREKLKVVSPRFESCLRSLEQASDPYYWSLTDCRCPHWTSGTCLLLGDAAAGFLPTAGIGAGMAMESAWVLCRMLRYADRENTGILLKAYEDAQRPRVEAAQGNSRDLARVMFHQSPLLAWMREALMRLVSVKIALKPIRKLVAGRPDPDGLAKKALEN